MVEPYLQTQKQLEKSYKTSFSQGLSHQEATARLTRDGLNSLPTPHQESLFFVFLHQFKNPLIYLLVCAAILIWLVGDSPLDAFVVCGILLFNALVGTVQEGRARNVLKELHRFIKTETLVIRDGHTHVIPSSELVVGDSIILQEGDRVPADARLCETKNLSIDEAVLTGESVPVYKHAQPLEGQTSLNEQKNMVFRGSSVATGTGRAVIVAIGIDTYIAQIGATAQSVQVELPIKRELDRLSYYVLFGLLALCLTLFIIGLLYQKSFSELLSILGALFICAVPEGLPVVLTLVLVSGVHRMAQSNVLIKKMRAVEGLGRTSIIVTDKTGTLTRNEMMVTALCTGPFRWTVSGEGYRPEGTVRSLVSNIPLEFTEQLTMMATAAHLLNSAEITRDNNHGYTIKGDPTEAALSVFAQKYGINPEEITQQYTLLYEMPFSPETRYHVGLFSIGEYGLLLLNGSPETVQNMCDPALEEDPCLTSMLHDGLRMVAFASKGIDLSSVPLNKYGTQDLQEYVRAQLKNMQLLGYCGIQDAIRSDVTEVVKKTRHAGLQVIMATGDHLETALYVAKRVGIFKEGDHAITGPQFEKLTDAEAKEIISNATVYARFMPEQKLRLISLLRKNNNIVAMTGDGVNDVPAMLAADISISMGRIGTEITREASDLVLLDDSFVSIVRAIEQGRHIFYSLRRVVLYFFSTNLAEVLLISIALVLNMPLPLLPVQILWLNLVTDGFLDVGLAFEPPSSDLLQRDARVLQKSHLIDNHFLWHTVYLSIPMAIGSLAVFYGMLTYNEATARTMTLLTMALFQWFNAWNCRSTSRSLFALKLFSNKPLIIATGVVFIFQLLVIYAPFFQYLFRTKPLTLSQWIISLLVASTIIVWEEVRKAYAKTHL